jgi:quinohemoprotein ethanol dehydrogenase
VPYESPVNGGLLTTAGNLVFQGTGDGRMVAYDAKNGNKLWESPSGTGVIAPPITYLADGVQYVTLLAGWGGAWALEHKPKGETGNFENAGRIFTFALGGTTPMPGFRKRLPVHPYIPPEGFSPDPAGVASGDRLYHTHCSRCHGSEVIQHGVIYPDLRYSSEAIHSNFIKIVLEGLLEPNGMPSFGDRLSQQEVASIEQYVISRAMETGE